MPIMVGIAAALWLLLVLAVIAAVFVDGVGWITPICPDIRKIDGSNDERSIALLNLRKIESIGWPCSCCAAHRLPQLASSMSPACFNHTDI